MDPIFLYQRWLDQRLHQYVTSPRPPRLRGRKVALSPTQYGAALMQGYFGQASLGWISKQTKIPVKRLREWRQEPQFLLVMDWSKPIFSKALRENLALNDYTVAQYHYISAEISLLEESLRVAARVPLYQSFAKLGRSLISRHQNTISLSNYDLRLFRRFFLFFLALEYHWPSSAQKRISEDFLPLARDVIWPLLDDKFWVGPALESVQQTSPLSHICLVLESELSDTLQRFL
ncbi:MAG: hypothetical protein LJE87_06770 [Deltaproteobacteria bacterium]|nr:hypothetical protein [Deltaproteobacteria bacterium]